MDGLPISEKENNPPGQSNENFAQECPAGTIGANSTKILQWQTGSHERSIQNQGMTKGNCGLRGGLAYVSFIFMLRSSVPKE